MEALNVPHQRLSLYANDLVIFIVPTKQDIKLVRVTDLETFAGASDLHMNISKFKFIPI
jgi:hypothetical protein